MSTTTWTHLLTLDQSIMTQQLDRDAVVDQEYRQKRELPGFKEQFLNYIYSGIEDAGYWLRYNDYPYLMPQGVCHRVFWFVGDISMRQAKGIVCRDLDICSDQVVVACNSLPLKTIPELDHYHVFINHTVT